ncbi:MAG: phosphoribosylanthranilate isomerase [Bryobacterales bacterium]|nr:phosphoribosylanthranilate isomerase [Bryobacterales bacterium]
MSVRVKICGITREQDAEWAVSLGADMIGLNFYPPSPRSISLERAGEIRRVIGHRCEVVGVFVNSARGYIEQRMRELKLDYLQFHGDEEQGALDGWPVRVIRGLRLGNTSHNQMIPRCRADYILLDAWHPELFGGTGRTRAFDLAGLQPGRVILAGGLTPENVAQAAALRPYAVDVASGVESAPGIKDAARLRSFILNAKSSG